MPVLPKHAIDVATFENSTLAKPIGSGPYVVAEVDPGKSVTFKRDPNYWGRDLPINRGLWNFDELRFDFYRDDNAYFEAFKAGLYDVRSETDPSRWQTGYDFPAAARRPRGQGIVPQAACRNSLPTSSSTRGGRFLPTSACARRSRYCSISNGSIATSSTISTERSASYLR